MSNDEKPIGTITHDETRANIPSAELEAVMRPDDKAPIRTAWERRNRDLDPQLIWRGKDPDQAELTVDAPPIYMQEQVHPKALIDDLRAGREKADDLFGHFGLDEEDREAEVEFYRHSRKWSNRMILGDGLQVMASLAEREGLRGQVQAIYIDPPYGIKFQSNFQWSTTSRDVKDGKLDNMTREPEQVKAFRDTWRDGIHSYITYLRDRLVVAREMLTESGSCFVQIGDENVHRVRALMDEVFGEDNCVAQITLAKTAGTSTGSLPLVADYILWYAKKRETMKWRGLLRDKQVAGASGDYKMFRGVSGGITKAEEPDTLDKIALDNTVSQRPPQGADLREFLEQGIRAKPGPGTFKTDKIGLTRLSKASRLFPRTNSIRYVRCHLDYPVLPINNIWIDIRWGFDASQKRYVVETHRGVIERCLLMTTDPGDIVLDPTCGSGTTAHVAEQWGRRWITIDTSRVALALARARVMGAKYPWYLLSDSDEGIKKTAEVTREAPSTHATHNDIRHGFVYERVPHIMLSSIARNSEIDVIWDKLQPAVEAARAALNAALLGHAEPFPIDTGGRAGQEIDFNATGTVTMPSGEDAPANGFMEWEIPRTPGTPWPAEHRKLLDTARKASKPGAPTAAAKRALAQLNHLRSAKFTHDDLPDDPRLPWPDAAVAALEAFSKARIARQTEIDASIAAKADHEYLYDKPYEDKKRVRVAGPFTVESLSPHRTQAVDEHGELIDEIDASRGRRPASEMEAENYYKAIMENLAKAGVHQQDKKDAIRFDTLTAWDGQWIAAEGQYMEGDTPRRAGVFIGPEYGTVSRADLVDAAREAADGGFDIVIACAFNFEAHAQEFHRLGRIPILHARMNADLHMAGDLKAGGGNLFVVFGEPDIELIEEGDRLRVELKGVDIFRPQTGEVESSDADDIACWFIDTDYSGESFFVRQAYFPGADVPYKQLRATLKGEIDEEAWDSLKRTTSRSFAKPKSGRIAVKVINHLGDEVMKVIGV
ncbi:site-specific DNA-methyltransferase [uncultured Sulfitobacter sp.]|uniref:site-specific DNA-methyltransferase n=1 Tax=uncultured Sulfitobacter sp. TaxID=191468 RepID=UPI002614F370|nr:site-specific DNA-methyltransferase [uncultured Sulfitobacter sp.]